MCHWDYLMSNSPFSSISGRQWEMEQIQSHFTYHIISKLATLFGVWVTGVCVRNVECEWGRAADKA